VPRFAGIPCLLLLATILPSMRKQISSPTCEEFDLCTQVTGVWGQSRHVSIISIMNILYIVPHCDYSWVQTALRIVCLWKCVECLGVSITGMCLSGVSGLYTAISGQLKTVPNGKQNWGMNVMKACVPVHLIRRVGRWLTCFSIIMHGGRHTCFWMCMHRQICGISNSRLPIRQIF
jgi:hypothetical protein